MVYTVSEQVGRVSYKRNELNTLNQPLFARLVDGMNTLNTHLHLVEFICFGAMLCVLLFSLIIVSRGGNGYSWL